ncbi:cell envelope integrity protein TolA [Hugenholtzia roseola]|uniref:cell envelope integrity protein TolA n=1 Tax=Hugenholtzia roseola TaxID=1002 RepID=UPI000424CA8E|nr:cell envelope integrity protein TolA [Hugenholtzia roseola]
MSNLKSSQEQLEDFIFTVILKEKSSLSFSNQDNNLIDSEATKLQVPASEIAAARLTAIGRYEAKIQAQKELEERQAKEQRELEEQQEAEREALEKQKAEEARRLAEKQAQEAQELQRQAQEREEKLKQKQLEEKKEQEKRHHEEQEKIRRARLKKQLKIGAVAFLASVVLGVGGFFGLKAIESSEGVASLPFQTLSFTDTALQETDLLGEYYGKTNQEIISLEIFLDAQSANALRYKFIGEGSRSYPLYLELGAQKLNFNLPNRGLGEMQISKHSQGILLKNESITLTKNNP